MMNSGHLTARSATTLLSRAKVYPSPESAPIENCDVLVSNGRIFAVGPNNKIRTRRGTNVLDCSGLVVTAGFWNSHTHLLAPGLLHAESLSAEQISWQLEEMFTRWGFTTVFDIASVLENTNKIRRRVKNGEVRGPRILTVGGPFYAKGGTPIYVKRFLEANEIPSAEVNSVHEAVERVRSQIRDGADGVKIFTGSIVRGGVLIMPPILAKRIVAEGHKAGRPVFAHPSNMAGIEVALQSGVDVLAHTAPMSGVWTKSLTGRMKAAHIALIPTLTLFEVEERKAHASAEETEDVVNLALGELKAYSAAGGQILFGTDVGYIDQFDTAEEFRLMSRARMNFRQILASLTTSPAERFGYSDRRGRIVVGMDADLVVLKDDPAKDVAAFSKVRYAIVAGKVVYSTS